MTHIKKLFQKIQKFTLLDFAALLLPVFAFCIPFQRRLELHTQYTYISGIFNESLTNALYATDILLVIIVLFGFYSKLRHHKKANQTEKIIFWAIAAYIVLTALSISRAYIDLSLPFIVRLVFLAGLVVVCSKLFQKKAVLRLTLFGFALAGVFQSVIGILQFSFQKSLGLHIFGESPLSPEIIGVAKIVFESQKFIRVYGTFPHPNVFAAFLAISIPATMLLIYFTRALTFKRVRFFMVALAVLVLQYAALIFTFSRTGYIAAAITIGTVATIIFIYMFRERSVSLEIFNKFLIFLSVLTVMIGFIAYQFLPLLLTRTVIADQNGDFAVSERLFLVNVSRETFLSSPLLGKGLHTFVLQSALGRTDDIEPWRFQPTHNIYWLLLAEEGVIGLAGFLLPLGVIIYLTIFAFIKRKDGAARLIIAFSLAGTVSYLVIGFLDHHPWDAQQSQLTLWLLLGMAASQAVIVSRETSPASVSDQNVSRETNSNPKQ